VISDRGFRFALIPVRRVRFARRARAVRGRALMGLSMSESMLMTPGAQANEMKRIDNDMRSFSIEIADAAKAHGETVPHPGATASMQEIRDYAKALGAQPLGIGAQPIVTLYRNAWIPIWNAWSTFYADNKEGAWWSNPVSEAEKYQDQLIDIRRQAEALGIRLQTPGPKQEHPEGLPSWLLPVGVGVGSLVALSILARSGHE
jgi:hypothetical protein